MEPRPTTVTADQIIAWIERYSTRIAEQKELLTKLDSDIGDADHGTNMHRGFQAVLAKKAELQGKDIGALLKIVAMTLISTVGGAAGALYGTFFLQASSVTMGKTELTPEEFLLLLEKGLAGIVLRGKAAIGDKTMVDALHPAVRACRHAIGAHEPLDQALAHAEQCGAGADQHASDGDGTNDEAPDRAGRRSRIPPCSLRVAAVPSAGRTVRRHHR